jgi:hypothetical protein
LWTNDAAELAPFVRARNADWLLVYETFVEQANPELLEILDSGVPGFDLAFEAVDTRGRRGQIYELRTDEKPRRKASRVGAVESSPTADIGQIF